MSRLCFIAVACLAAWGAVPGLARAACTQNDSPTVSQVSLVPNTSNVTVQWVYNPATQCIYPPDFYQIRWTQGDGPQTQNQAKVSNTSWTLNGIDPASIYGFTVQGCSNQTLAPANCTPWSPMAFYKPYGPGTCYTGYVWRSAFPGDQVCVTPQTRDEAAADNAGASSRTNPDGTCITGFVWREANASDHICVTPPTRTEAAQDNGQAASHTLP